MGAAGWPAMAQTMPAPIIAVIDVASVERQSLAWDSLREQIDARREAFQSELSVKQKELEEERRNIQLQQTLLSQQTLNEMQQEFREKLNDLQQDAQEKKRELDLLYASGRQQIRDVMRTIIGEMAKERGINLFLDMSAGATVSIVDDALRIDEEVLNRLNQRLQTVTLTLAE